MLDWIVSPDRVGAAVALVAAYTAMCAAIGWREKLKNQWQAEKRAALQSPDNQAAATLVVYASQTGHAEALAQTTAHVLHIGGLGVHLTPIDQLTAQHLQDHPRSLWVLSTTGEGDAPDQALPFMQSLHQQSLSLAGHCSHVLALGDRSYAQFCAFGEQVFDWLAAQGAQGELLRMDRMDAATQQRWQQLVTDILPVSSQPSEHLWQAPEATQPWELRRRTLLNPGSQGGPVYQLEWEPVSGPLPTWNAGDLVEITVPSDPEHPRDYSIASIPSDGRLHLLVRVSTRPDGSTGLASGWLCNGMAAGQSVSLRIRPHRSFRLGDNAHRPLILIGNGTGLAGLMSLLKARIAEGQTDQWLLFGERTPTHDALLDAPLQAWLQQGQLQRLDRAWSRAEDTPVYVQHLLLDEAERVREWVQRDAAIYVCGSRTGMGEGVDQALRHILGDTSIQMLQAEGRYCRDVY